MATTPSTDQLDRNRLVRIGRHIESWGQPRLRPFPWRITRDPWEILVAEVMLQQTQASRVVPTYEAFLVAFPSPRACADAALSDVLSLWVGLGYNRRARNLWRSAGEIARAEAGFPDTIAGLEALPGVGPYTARAVLAFSFERDVGIVDTNVARVIARAVVGKPVSQQHSQRIADALVPSGRGWSYNQAVLDLGATTCTARQPTCQQCPLRRTCRWYRSGCALPDPARATFGTSRTQARFEGSDRQLRGRVVSTLRSGPTTVLKLRTALDVSPARLGGIVDGLVDDGLIERGGRGVLRLGVSTDSLE